MGRHDRSCAVRHFGARTRGQPHFGWGAGLQTPGRWEPRFEITAHTTGSETPLPLPKAVSSTTHPT